MEQEVRSESPGSEALQIFEAHSDNVGYLLRVIQRDVEQISDPADRMLELVAKSAGTLKNLNKGLSGSAQESDKVPISCGFLKGHEFYLRGGQALGLQQQIV